MFLLQPSATSPRILASSGRGPSEPEDTLQRKGWKNKNGFRSRRGERENRRRVGSRQLPLRGGFWWLPGIRPEPARQTLVLSLCVCIGAGPRGPGQTPTRFLFLLEPPSGRQPVRPLFRGDRDRPMFATGGKERGGMPPKFDSLLFFP